MTTLAEPEQLLLEMVNRARLDPEAEATRLGITLNQYIDPSSPGYPIDGTAKQVLAGNDLLAGVAESHSVTMRDSGVLANGGDPHNGAGDGTPSQRIANAGYVQNNLSYIRNENVAWAGTSSTLTDDEIEQQTKIVHNNLFKDDPSNSFGEGGGHRLAMLDDNMREIGIGEVTGVISGFNAVVVTENFGVSGTQSFLTGVVYTDTNGDDFYGFGEARQNVTVAVTNAGAAVGADTTGSGGGWSLGLGATSGTYTVTFSGGGLAAAVSATVEAGTRNAKVDLVNGNEIFASADTTLGANAKELHLLGIANLNGTGNAGDNVMVGGRGNNILDGAGGTDTAVYQGTQASYGIVQNADGSITVSGAEGTDTLKSIEKIQFSDGVYTPVSSSDLTVTNFTLSGATASFQVHNVGTSGVGASTTGIYLSTNSTISTSDTLIGTRSTPALAAGASDNESVVLSLTARATAGTYFVGAYADYNGQITETGENNNASTGVPVILGTTGADNLNGTTGNDTIFGFGGADSLHGGGGNDTLSGGAGNDQYYVDSASDVVKEAVNEGTADRVYASVNYTLAAGSEVEALATDNSAGTSPLTLIGNEFAQTITGNAGANTLKAGGGTAADVMSGLGGNDSYYVTHPGDRIVEAVNGGTDRVYASVSYALTAGAQVETITTDNSAGTSPINLTGNEFAQTITGNAGANRLDGKGGIDSLSGLGGNDLYYVDNAADRVFESVNGGNDRVYTSVSFALAAGQEIETLVTTLPTATTAINLTGNEFAQTIVANAGANTIDGKGGIDLMYGLGGNDFYYVDNSGDRVFESAHGGNDRVYTSVSYALAAGQEIETLVTTLPTATTAINLTGNEFAQTIVGNAGANIIDGKGGIDLMYGQGGNDFYYVDNASDRVFESVNGGNDRVYTSVSYALGAGQEIETFLTKLATATTAINLTGNEFAQTIVGNAGANIIDGKGGIDLMYGQGGNDFYYVDNASDRVFESAGGGNDRVYASVSYALAAGQEIETFVTKLSTATTAINLTGNEFAQTIVGNAGANIIDGKGGNDLLYGSGGNDRFVFDTALNASTNVDRIFDFTASSGAAGNVDKIALDDAIFGALNPAHTATPFALSAAAFTTAAPVNANQHIIYNATTGALSYDDDGSGGHTAIQFAILTTHPALTNADFLVV